MKRSLIRLLLGLSAAAGFFSCAPPPGAPAMDSAPAASDVVTGRLRSGDQALNRRSIDALLNNPARPGLATGWGNEKRSEVSTYDFVRASSKPTGVDMIYYNDKAGIRAMADSVRKVEPMQRAAGGLVEWGVKSRGGFLAVFREYGHGKRLVEGRPGANYVIVVRNRSRSTLEIVASVDGLDVMDGKSASVSRRGYLVHPGGTLEIDGFRTSYSTVAAFKFSSVSNSYANLRHGDTRNVGVIGIAVFTQKGVDPWRSSEAIRRNEAKPFAEAPVVRGGPWAR